MSHEQGKYIVIEGHDGTGKSSQVGKIRERLAQHSIESIEFHEPAGTPIADAIRTVIKDGTLERDAETDLLLFTAARHEIWREAKQKLRQGLWVVAARNYLSTLAYQGQGGGLSLDLIEDMTRRFTDQKYMHPDLAVVLDVPDAVRKERIAGRGELETPDTFEMRNQEFQDNVYRGYRQVARWHGIDVIDASPSLEEVTEVIWEKVSPLISLNDARK